jgi:DNA gyrase/topoisomerase IV subunit A
MANTTAAKKPRKGNVRGHFSREDKNKVIKTDLISFANKNYESYGRATLEDRALPDYRDGLLPVTRRLLWSAHVLGVDSKSKFVKSLLDIVILKLMKT